MQQPYGTRSRAKLIGSLLAIIIIAGIVIVADQLKSKNTLTTSVATNSATQPSTGTITTPTTSSTATTDTSASTTAASTSSYTDGAYSASSSYYVPHGNESIKVSVTIKNGVITDSSIENSEDDHESAQYQEDFASVYKNYIVGKSISGLQLSRIAGASDTTQGFNDALNQIASEAKA